MRQQSLSEIFTENDVKRGDIKCIDMMLKAVNVGGSYEKGVYTF